MTAFFYSLIFIIPGIFALESSIKGVHSNHIFFACFVVVLSLIIGLRFEVGPDWFLYVSNMEIYSEFSFANFFLVSDPGYAKPYVYVYEKSTKSIECSRDLIHKFVKDR